MNRRLALIPGVSILLGFPLARSTAAAPSASAVLSLPAEQRVEVVKAALRQRKQQLFNVEFSNTVEVRNFQLNGEEKGAEGKMHTKSEYRFLRKGNSVRFECIDTSFIDHPGGEEMYRWQSGINEKSGEFRVFQINAKWSTHAEISYDKGFAARFNYLAYFLSGEIANDVRAHIENVFYDYFNIAVEPAPDDKSSLMLVMVPKNDPILIRLILQPEHGYSVKYFERTHSQEKNGKLKKLFDEWEKLLEEKEIDGVWFPMKVRREAKLYGKNGAIFDMVTTSVKIGAVTDEDLKVVFPPGSEVTDRINKIAYVEGKREDSLVNYAGKTLYKPPIAILKEKEKQRAENRRPWYIWVNVGAIAACAGLLLFRRFYVRRSSSA